jgi:hypothetical protein
MRNQLLYVGGLAIALLSMATAAQAGGPINVPEIDGVSLSAGLGLLAAGVLVVRSRRRSK